jgi:hypothetical protein
MPERDPVLTWKLRIVSWLRANCVRGDPGLEKNGFHQVAANLLEMTQRICGDTLQPAAFSDMSYKVISALNDANDYTGPAVVIGWLVNAGEKCRIYPRQSLPKKSSMIVSAGLLKIWSR